MIKNKILESEKLVDEILDINKKLYNKNKSKMKA